MDYTIQHNFLNNFKCEIIDEARAEDLAYVDPFWKIAVWLRHWQRDHSAVVPEKGPSYRVGLTGVDGQIFSVRFQKEADAENCYEDALAHFADSYEIADNIFISYKSTLSKRNLCFFDPDREYLKGWFNPEKPFDVKSLRIVKQDEDETSAVEEYARKLSEKSDRYHWFDTAEQLAEYIPDYPYLHDFLPGLWDLGDKQMPAYLMYQPGDDVITFPDATCIQVEYGQQEFPRPHFDLSLYRDYSGEDMASPIVRRKIDLASAGMHHLAVLNLDNSELKKCGHRNFENPLLDECCHNMYRIDNNWVNMSIENLAILCANCMDIFHRIRRQAIREGSK